MVFNSVLLLNQISDLSHLAPLINYFTGFELNTNIIRNLKHSITFGFPKPNFTKKQ